MEVEGVKIAATGIPGGVTGYHRIDLSDTKYIFKLPEWVMIKPGEAPENDMFRLPRQPSGISFNRSKTNSPACVSKPLPCVLFLF
jgi:hypothetical protein